MIIAIVDDGGRIQVYNSASGRIVSGEVEPLESGAQESPRDHSRPAPPDRRLDEILGLLRKLLEKVNCMSQTQDTVASEVAALKQNMVDLHSGVSGIQSRLDAALAKSGQTTDPAVLADLHSINDDLRGVVTSLAPAAPASSGTGSDSSTVAGAAASPAASDPASAPQPEAPQPVVDNSASSVSGAAAAPVVFNAADPTPNAPGGRNSSQLPNFDQSVAETA